MLWTSVTYKAQTMLATYEYAPPPEEAAGKCHQKATNSLGDDAQGLTPAGSASLAAAALLAACGGGGGGAADGAGTTVPALPPAASSSSNASANAYAYPAPASDEDAARFLLQAQFSASDADIAAVRSKGYAPWLAEQMRAPASQTGFDWLNSRGYGTVDSTGRTLKMA